MTCSASPVGVEQYDPSGGLPGGCVASGLPPSCVKILACDQRRSSLVIVVNFDAATCSRRKNSNGTATFPCLPSSLSSRRLRESYLDFQAFLWLPCNSNARIRASCSSIVCASTAHLNDCAGCGHSRCVTRAAIVGNVVRTCDGPTSCHAKFSGCILGEHRFCLS